VTGAEALLVEREQEDAALERLVSFSTDGRSLSNGGVLERVGELAWVSGRRRRARFGGGIFIADMSAWARASHAAVAKEWTAAILGRQIATTPT
jgi:hypothetical protein